ncbi:MAG: SOS response-associated peptidase [Alphaproteobacteria bacterium]
MCGRYKQNTDGDVLADLFRARRRTRQKEAYGTARPGTPLPVLRENAQGRFIDDLNWGFVPHWAKDAKAGRFINARAESAAEKPSFRDAYRLRRCLIPADGFVEWDARTSPKTAYEITLPPPRPFVFAGVWDRWTDPANGQSTDSFAILTIAAAAALHGIHDRMPVILTDSGDIDRWLARDSTPAALADITARAALHVFDITADTESPAPALQGRLL